MSTVEFDCRPTLIGSLPQTDPVAACSLIQRYFKDIPAWPQLPRRSFLENMYVQFSHGFPGAVIEYSHTNPDLNQDRIFVNQKEDIHKSLESLGSAFLGDQPENYAITTEYASGLHQFLNMSFPASWAIKGQTIGPISWTLALTDDEGKPILFNDLLVDAAAKMLRIKISWQEKQLRRLNKNTIIIIDEPYFSSYGSTFLPLSKNSVHSLLTEVMGGISGLKGIHCCGNTDWSIISDIPIDIISFDAYNYADHFNLHISEINRFTLRSGSIAWGIVPNIPEYLAKETVSSLMDRLGEAIAPLTRSGIPFRTVLKQSLLTPSCSLITCDTQEMVEYAFQLLVELSLYINKHYL